MNIEILKQLLLDQRELFFDFAGLINRDMNEKISDLIKAPQIIVISGVRRAGKSSLLKLITKELLNKNKVDKEQILYVNFDDEFFVGFEKKNFNDLLFAYYELSNINKKKKIYCFFDEIQNVPYWEKFVSKLYERKNFKIFITGSNSSLLSSEIATSLTGRNYTLELFPFSFREYLNYFKVDYSSGLTTQKSGEIKKYFNKYFVSGGFPEILQTNLDILPEYYKNIIYRDIISRFKIKNIKEFRELVFYLISNISSLMSYRQLAKKIDGIDSANTTKNYISFLEYAYLFFTLRKLDTSIRKQRVSPFKIYNIDNGLVKRMSFGVFGDYGKLYENLVYLHLRRSRDLDIYYFKEDYEVDFVVIKNKKIKDIIQVCYSLSKHSEEREQRALLEALNFLNKKKGYIINNYIEKEEKIKGKTIKYIPLWKWLLFYL